MSLEPKKGQLLIAEPSIIGDLSFNRSIVLLVEHTHEGSVGFILNKPTDFGLMDLVDGFKNDFRVYNGGPVEQDSLYFVHNAPDLIPNSVKIANSLYWGGDFDTVTALINSGLLTKNNIRFFLGYSGWGKNQLNSELKTNAWVVLNNVYGDNILSKNEKTFWKDQMMELGDKYRIWANAPENPNYN
jgi:putative transcriptional regulator